MELDIHMNPNILVSILNMKLRNEFEDINDLVSFYDIDKDELFELLGKEDYFYCEDKKQFLIK